jgi:hypothetical protein
MGEAVCKVQMLGSATLVSGEVQGPWYKGRDQRLNETRQIMALLFILVLFWSDYYDDGSKLQGKPLPRAWA